jgi:MoaA/NifB/PqqE/SkfB family radical SAM enzyme
LRETRRYNTTILLSTNGQNLNKDEVIKTILENPPTFLIVAIDGLTDESNAKFRIGARLEPILQGIRRLSEAKKLSGQTFPILHMRFIVMKHNQHELPETAAFASKNGFDLLTVRTLSPINSESGRRFHIQMGTDLPEFNTHPDDSGDPVYRKNYICMQPFWYPSLYADGTLVACEQDFNAVQPLGVLNEELNFSKIWFSSAAAAVRRRIRDESSDLPFCARCPNCYRPMTDTSVSATWLCSGIPRPVIPEGGIHVK